MRWLPRSIRWRIQIWHGALLLLVLAVLGVTAYRLQAGNEYQRVDAALAERVSVLARVLDRPPEDAGAPPWPGDRPPRPHFPGEEPPDFHNPDGGPPPGGFRLPPELADLFGAKGEGGFYYVVWSRSGEVMGQSANAPAIFPTLPGTRQDIVRTRQGWREQLHFTPPGECLLAGVSEDSVRHSLMILAWELAALGGGVLIAGLAGGWWLASRAIAPIDEISAAALRIAEGDLQERINPRETESELGQLAGVLNYTFMRLGAAFAKQKQFTSDAAHELRTPVSIVLAHAQLALTKPRSPAEYQEALVTIQRAAHRMRYLVESLLELALLDSEGDGVDLASCDLAELAREQMELIGPLAAERGISLQADFAAAPCRGDLDRLAQIFTNLLTNAVKYCDRGDRVQISTLTENGHALARVSDTGPGISAEHLPHVFERFYRVDASRTRATGGAGLGLAICRTIAQAHGGEMEVEPAGERGVIFTLRVPRQGS